MGKSNPFGKISTLIYMAAFRASGSIFRAHVWIWKGISCRQIESDASQRITSTEFTVQWVDSTSVQKKTKIFLPSFLPFSGGNHSCARLDSCLYLSPDMLLLSQCANCMAVHSSMGIALQEVSEEDSSTLVHFSKI